MPVLLHILPAINIVDAKTAGVAPAVSMLEIVRG